MNPIIRGDYRRILVRFKINGTYIDQTGGVVFFTMKKRLSDTYEQAALRKKVAGTGTETAIELSHDDTKALEPIDYHYDVQFVDSAGKPITLKMGKVSVIADTTEVIA